jgi:glycosyltransferase involved in cell wall biosynthesis
MNILLTSHRFFPEIGGTETVTELLAEAFYQAGHKPIIVTRTEDSNGHRPAGPADTFEQARSEATPYQVVRRPSPQGLLQLYRWCDVVLQIQIGLQTAWPLILVNRPWVISHHNWIDVQRTPQAWLKRRVLRFARHIAASQALADRLPVPSTLIPNPYRKEVFKPPISEDRPMDLIFVGRLIRGKGVHVLIEALQELARNGVRRELTVVGDGPALPDLVQAAQELPIKFVGTKRGGELGELLGQHRFLIVPSIDPEPFGIVAIEGLACRCTVVASRNSGLIEAVDAHGVFCEPGDPKSLAEAILEADAASGLMDGVVQHLARHDPQTVADQYLNVLSDASRRRHAAGKHP